MILIATDLDRTLLPNGPEEDCESLELFYKEIKKIDNLILVYVTGRNLELFNNAKKEFSIINPDYLIASVGTEIFKKIDEKMHVYKSYTTYLKKEHPNWNRSEIIEGLSQDQMTFLQEEEVQNPFKISYYNKDINPHTKVVANMREFLEEKNINAEVIYSFDPLKNVGLIDILPLKATKRGALEFLIREVGIEKESVVFAGDSGNDLAVLSSGIKSILVKNTREEVKIEAQRIVKKINNEDKLYIARGDKFSNGNYASGILEGLRHFDII